MPRPPARPRSRPDTSGPTLHAVPKPGGGVRWLVALDPADDDDFRAAVTPLVGRIERSLRPEVIANRARRGPGGWRVGAWRPARRVWRRTILAAITAAPRGSAVAVTDVRECYASIAPATIVRLLGPEAAHAVAMLERFADGGVRGLPIGPEPSAVLANAALAPLDAVLRTSGVRHVRWVDDVVMWGPHPDVRRALRALERAAAGLGLSLREDKTTVLTASEDARTRALGVRASGAG
jgi:hypothetical protein